FFQSGRELKYIMFFLILALMPRIHRVYGYAFSPFPLESLSLPKASLLTSCVMDLSNWQVGIQDLSQLDP
ncbi:MAG: hypothetical protein IJU92_02495, partial [Spirochaetaceae bacterium]|nr:hypothetical protein [Spirochaetaceae bacterium]